MKKLVVYYSYTIGNTKKIAEQAARAIGADLLEIDTKVPYTGSYDDVVNQGLDEVKRGFKPELKPYGLNPADYDEIVVGTPTWWYDMAPAVLTFMDRTDFHGKKVALFQTDAGWPGHCLKNMKKEARGADVIAQGLFDFSPNNGSRDEMTSPKKKVEDFIAKL